MNLAHSTVSDRCLDMDEQRAILPSRAVSHGYMNSALSAEDLVERAVRNAGRGGRYPKVRWGYVADLFAIGSTDACSGCSDWGTRDDERGSGCSECGYTGRRFTVWGVPVDLSQPPTR